MFTKKKNAAENRKLTARHPVTGKNDYHFRAPGPEQLKKDVSALRAAQTGWRDMGADARAQVLLEWRANIEARRDALFEALAADTGRRKLATDELDAFLATISRWAHDGPSLIEENQAPSKYFPHISILSAGDPYPVVGAISPWNFPLLLAFIDALPALMAGSSVFVKPSEVTPRFVDPLNEAIAATPELSRVLKVAAGDGLSGAALVDLVDVVAFTGSVATGRKVGEAAASAFIPAFLELGGKDPAIVLNGADLDRASTALLRASIIATGQACQSIERIYVAADIFDDFVAKLTEKAKAVKLTLDDPNGVTGPLIFEKQADVIADHLKDAKAKGAVIHCGGEVRSSGGHWIAPTVVTNATHDMKLMREETFGPIMPVMSFETVGEAVRLANDTAFGLSASVFAATDEEALAVGRRLDAGGVSINDAGMTTMIFESEKSGFKLSGMGPSRMGASGLTRFLRRKSFYINKGDVASIEAYHED